MSTLDGPPKPPQLPGRLTVESTKKLIQEATTETAKKAIRHASIPLFAIINYNPSPEASKLMERFWQWQKDVNDYLDAFQETNPNWSGALYTQTPEQEAGPKPESQSEPLKTTADEKDFQPLQAPKEPEKEP